MGKYKDDISEILEGQKNPPAPPPVEEQLKIKERSHVSKNDGWSAPHQKMPPPAMSGEEEVRYRSAGKGHEGLDQDEKFDMSRICFEIRNVVGHAEAQRIAFLLQEEAAKHRKWVEKLRKDQGDRAASWSSPRIKRLEHLAKEMRSG